MERPAKTLKAPILGLEFFNANPLSVIKWKISWTCQLLGEVSAKLDGCHTTTEKFDNEDVPWNWSETQEKSFQEVKKKVINTPVLIFYDPGKELVIESDACEHGLGSVLLQDNRPVAYSSRALSDAKHGYAQIEKVMDHKPLVSIVLS